jgi:chromosome segregation ATPase
VNTNPYLSSVQQKIKQAEEEVEKANEEIKKARQQLSYWTNQLARHIERINDFKELETQAINSITTETYTRQRNSNLLGPILKVLRAEPDEWFSLTKLADRTNLKEKQVYMSLYSQLKDKTGTIEKTKEGGYNFYRANMTEQQKAAAAIVDRLVGDAMKPSDTTH